MVPATRVQQRQAHLPVSRHQTRTKIENKHDHIGTSVRVTVAQIDQIYVCRAPLSCTGSAAPNAAMRFSPGLA